MQLCDVIKITRQRAFLSQEEFASELKVSSSTINRWETGKVKPNLTAMKNLKQFCEKHNLPYSEIEGSRFQIEEKE